MTHTHKHTHTEGQRDIEKENTKEFIKYLKSLDEKQQIGLHLTIEGLKVLSEQQKKRHENR